MLVCKLRNCEELSRSVGTLARHVAYPSNNDMFGEIGGRQAFSGVYSGFGELCAD